VTRRALKVDGFRIDWRDLVPGGPKPPLKSRFIAPPPRITTKSFAA